MAIFNVPGNFLTIQAAVNSVSDGDIIIVENDTYNEEVTIPSVRDDIRIVANGKNVILDAPVPGSGVAFDIAGGANRIEIKGFKIQNYAVGIELSSDANRIICNKITNVDVGIMIDGGDRNLIWKNTVKDATTGIFIDSNDNWIIENIVHGNDTGMDLDGADGILILGNKIFDNNIVGITMDSSSSECALLNNEIKDNDGDGLELFPDNCIVSRNKIKRNDGNGIDTGTGSDDNLIQENIIEKNTENGIAIVSGAIRNDIIRNCINFNGEDGINIDGNNNNLVQNKVCSNTMLDIDNNGTNNDFFDNECKNSDPPSICTSINCNPCICEFFDCKCPPCKCSPCANCPFKGRYCKDCPYKSSYNKCCDDH
ncbi:right-handed parallel beta-helix repeat-containing protein [Anaeromicrobium sediminis]|uniref:Right handed beta helix domain-containing protein n=1 Tax=Anaeromicrobium sediminis TaxID=1478221 RepID=A0A267MJA6_9FIRM|nr:right-handed parallel beta-helix repeat-containing protein [Anaeromicrobium sediminis]PAB59502.1 hypothetical protein CCE28_09815 [Anaeromicrobium sediminis]